ncbi:MAG: Mut7-C RNAse domain-containing protein [Gammaproteobacteria bacterium]|nr:Mut7-C RNAse domain-containing protein [Gammaproteobacteria bacterium]
MKFLCDEMLQRLGSWLRAAGYDTLIAQGGRSDYELLKQALAEDRLLITRDRKLLEHRRAPGTVILLDCNELDDCARELSQKLSINWLHQPFVRCMVCNSSLRPATENEAATLPEKIKSQIDSPLYCPSCQKVYWDGGHVDRMRIRLGKWQSEFNTDESAQADSSICAH